MNIKTQQYLGAWISVATVLVMGMTLFVASERVNQATDRRDLASEIVIGISELRFVTFEYILHHHERPRVQWQQRHDTVASLLASDTFEGTDQQRIVNVLRQRHQDLNETFSRLTQYYASGRNGRNGPAETALSRELEARVVGELVATSQEMISATFRLARVSESEAANTQRWTGILFMLAIVLMVLIVLANTVLSIRYVLKPIGRLQHGIEIIGKGDLSYRTGITSSNEIGALSQAFDRMTTRVEESRAALEAERLRAARHEAIRESEVRYRGVVESVMEGIITVDERQHIVLFNHGAERIFGRSAAAMIGEPLGMLVPERYRARHEERVRRFAATGQTSRAMGRYGLIHGLRADGTEFPVEATVSQSGTSPNKLLIVILRDITERMRTEQALRDYAEQLQQLSRRLFEVEESERRRLARELHDRIGQNVTALSLNLNMVRGELPADCLRNVGTHLDDCETLLFSTAQLVRDVMADLRPPGLDELGLLAALTEHARASEVTVALESGPTTVLMTIADNGLGFDTTARLVQPTSSLGMVTMRERAEAIGGVFRVESAPGHGTRVIVEAPRTTPNSSNQAHLPGLEPA